MSATLGAANIVAALLALFGLLVGVGGVTLYMMQRKRSSRRERMVARQRRLPQQWPLNPRPLANSAERQVWGWLRQVFPEHHIMVKLPVTRFTTPREHGAANDWFEVLSGAYCTFTICNTQGIVVGCVDVLGPRGLARGNRQLKQTLLAQCGIGYWVVSREGLPSADKLRADFLGTSPPDSLPPPEPTKAARLEEARHQLHEALDRNRSFRHHRALDGHGDDALQDGEVTPWPQADSFLGTLDSRRAPL